MHIPDSLLPPAIAIGGYAITGGTTWYALRQINKDHDPTQNIPKASLLTAAFFVASLIHFPVPPSSIHLILNGLMGIILGYYAFPAILIGLFFQAVLFGHGGISTLGVNALLMGIPALYAHHCYQWGQGWVKKYPLGSTIWTFFTSASALLLSAFLFVSVVIANIPADLDTDLERQAILISMIGYGIQSLIEGTIGVMVVSFLWRVKPELLPHGGERGSPF
ncbi:cobalt transporter CbiM [Spirulina subsalsa FACHB-351]|uniref:Cobalt transporter CbiM n=1 Tax=Spirulina subsalsa FACHB-351 TaxID=234711 RepID=A0ABT3L6D1_9CYAN|nr:cobalt transporter CbiM [Spirulina subsalsa]MCW6036550.1 cobalt transporter CbiM [Spirulina subsalsa FACHB-351]